MLATISGAMFLESTTGEFKPRNSDDVIKYSKATFFQPDGGSLTFNVDKDLNLNDLVVTSYYDLTVNLRESTSGDRKFLRGTVVDFVQAYGD